MLTQAGSWSGGGLNPRRLDRAAILARLADRGFDRWVLEGLMDAFEPAALNTMSAVEKRRSSRPAESSGKARRRRGGGEEEVADD